MHKSSHHIAQIVRWITPQIQEAVVFMTLWWWAYFVSIFCPVRYIYIFFVYELRKIKWFFKNHLFSLYSILLKGGGTQIIVWQGQCLRNFYPQKVALAIFLADNFIFCQNIGLKGVLNPWTLFFKTLCIFSKNIATSLTSDKVLNGSN